MSKYIDTEQLEDVATDLNSKGWGITRNDFKLIDRVLFEFPAADVEEVRHGRWIEASAEDPCEYRCSECGWLTDDEWNYCPYCGALMNGE